VLCFLETKCIFTSVIFMELEPLQLVVRSERVGYVHLKSGNFWGSEKGIILKHETKPYKHEPGILKVIYKVT